MASTTATAPRAKIDRQTRTPFLLKLFYRTGQYHRPDEFIPSPTSPLPPHLQIYTWFSCSLRELTHLLTSALPHLLPDPAIGTTLVFGLLFPDTRAQSPVPVFRTRDLGRVVIGAGAGTATGAGGAGGESSGGGDTRAAGKTEDDADMTLQDVLPQFIIGDYITCTVFPPLANGAVAASLPYASRGGGGGGRGDFGGGRGGGYGGPRENGYGGGGGGFRVRGGARGGGVGMGMGGFGGERDRSGIPTGEWRRGERVPEGGQGTFGRGRGRGRGY